MTSGLSLLVLRAQDIERTRQFYELLGLRFTREKHGSGPKHFAAVLPGDTVLEIYPSRRARAEEGVRLGLRLDDPEEAIARIVAAGLAGAARGSGRGSRSVDDPDGNTVELTAWVVPRTR